MRKYLHISNKAIWSIVFISGQSELSDTAYPLISVSYQADCAEGRHPSLELIHPVVESGLGHQNHVRTGDVSVVLHITQQRDGLQSLPQTLCVQDAVVHVNTAHRTKVHSYYHSIRF